MSIFEKDRIGLIGPNGSGKSTFLKILAGLEKSDEGTLAPRRGLSVGYVPQTSEFLPLSPKQVLIDSIQAEMADYEKNHLAENWLTKLRFEGSEPTADLLSGGWKKRLALAAVLINAPDLLLLDEPTNHLDLEGILWLEKFLIRQAPTYLLISHDRYFLGHTVNRVIEMDKAYPNGSFARDGSYSHFLEQREIFLQGQLQQEKRVATKARRETEWLKAGVKARTTKAQSRIDEAEEILKTHAALKARNTQKKAEIDFAATERQTRKLLTAKNLSKTIGGRLLFEHLDFTLSPGTRIGLMGPNGSGKTTLLRLLGGEDLPDAGTIKRVEGLQTVYFDQHRAKLPDSLTLREALSPKGDYVLFRGRLVHINGWCKRFLFSPDLLDLKIGNLSGGERARIAIAHLMLQPADLLLLDEPTNDLDIPTLETLEESLLEFPGAVVLISHDRCMLDRLCNVFLALGTSAKNELFASYAQWEAALSSSTAQAEEPKRPSISDKKGKLSYLEKKEYESIETKISSLEQKVKELNSELEKPEIAQNSEKLSDVCKEIGLLENKIELLYLRFEELDKKLYR